MSNCNSPHLRHDTFLSVEIVSLNATEVGLGWAEADQDQIKILSFWNFGSDVYHHSRY